MPSAHTTNVKTADCSQYRQMWSWSAEVSHTVSRSNGGRGHRMSSSHSARMPPTLFKSHGASSHFRNLHAQSHIHNRTYSAAVVLRVLCICLRQNYEANDRNPEANVAQGDSYFIIGRRRSAVAHCQRRTTFHFISANKLLPIRLISAVEMAR